MIIAQSATTECECVAIKDDNCSFQEEFFKLRQIGDERSKLPLRLMPIAPKEDNGRFRFAAQGQQCTKISVGRDNNPIFTRCPGENSFIGGCVHLTIAHMGSIMA